MDPTMCQHDQADMQKGGNTQSCKWWTCKKCLSRWERIPQAHLLDLSAEPTDMDLVTFGKHQGERYHDGYLMDPGYCHWVVQEAQDQFESSSLELKRFARYLLNTEAANANLEQHLIWNMDDADLEL